MEAVKNFISTFMVAVSNCSLYTKEHETIDELVKKAHDILNKAIDDRLEIMIVDDELIVNNSPLRTTGKHGENLRKRLTRKGIARLDFLEGVTLSEVRNLIIDVAEAAREVQSSDNIKTGYVEITLYSRKRVAGNAHDAGNANDAENSHAAGNAHDAGNTHDTGNADDAGNVVYVPATSVNTMDVVKGVFDETSSDRAIDILSLVEVVVNFVATFKKEANVLKMLSPVKAFSEYTYTHATNVSVLSLFQAESLGIEGQLLHDIGVSALLHDVGKLLVPKEILEKKGKLDDEEFYEIKKHPLYGARYLAKMDNVTRLAPIIAFEHHRKYDGSGYPQLQLDNKKQHICSQIVAIADFFDAMRSRRPYRGSIDLNTILKMMQENAGKDFNPALVEHFINIMCVCRDTEPAEQDA